MLHVYSVVPASVILFFPGISMAKKGHKSFWQKNSGNFFSVTPPCFYIWGLSSLDPNCGPATWTQIVACAETAPSLSTLPQMCFLHSGPHLGVQAWRRQKGGCGAWLAPSVLCAARTFGVLGFWFSHSALCAAGTLCLPLGEGGWEEVGAKPTWCPGEWSGSCLAGGGHALGWCQWCCAWWEAAIPSSLSFGSVLLHSMPKVSGVQIPHVGSSQSTAQLEPQKHPQCHGRAGVTVAPLGTHSHAEGQQESWVVPLFYPKYQT